MGHGALAVQGGEQPREVEGRQAAFGGDLAEGDGLEQATLDQGQGALDGFGFGHGLNMSEDQGCVLPGFAPGARARYSRRMALIDPVEFAQALIRRPSVTPHDAGAMDVLQHALEGLGFACRRMRFGEIENLYARRGTAAPNLCFAGHTDVVAPGDVTAWRHGPFEGRIEGGMLHGRGAADMKGGIAAFVAAVSAVLAAGEPRGSLSLLITGDEEGVAEDGTRRVVEALQIDRERIDHCIVGEPSSAQALGDMIKIGRRGSLNAMIMVEGRQGHVAYPQRAFNPLPPLIALLARLQAHRLDDGYPQFQPSNLEITTVDVGNPTTNVIPARAAARLNIRFNPGHTAAGLSD